MCIRGDTKQEEAGGEDALFQGQQPRAFTLEKKKGCMGGIKYKLCEANQAMSQLSALIIDDAASAGGIVFFPSCLVSTKLLLDKPALPRKRLARPVFSQTKTLHTNYA